MSDIKKLMEKSEELIMKTVMPRTSFGNLMGISPEDYRTMQEWYTLYNEVKEYTIEKEEELDDYCRNVEKLIKLVEAQANEINELKNMVGELAKTNELIEE